MSSLTPRLGLKKPATTDAFLTLDFDSLYDLLDSYPGIWVCTSTTLPTWTTAQAGQFALCTDTKTPLLWTGTAWVDPLVAPPAWDLLTSLSTSVTAGDFAGSPTIATFTVGTFSSSRAGTGLFHYNASCAPEDYARVFRVYMNLSVNGTQVTGTAYASQNALIPANGTTNITSVLPTGTSGSGRLQFGSYGTAPIIKGTNTVTITFNYAARTDSPSGTTPFYTDSAGPALGIYDAHMLASMINTSAT